MTKFIKIIISFFAFVFLFLICDIIFFYYTALQERDFFESKQKYSSKKRNFVFPKYFIKVSKFEDAYKHSTKRELRPIQNPQSKEQPILIFGCSYAYGYIFDNTETISYILSKYSNRPIINRSINGWGIQHMLYQLKEDKSFTSSVKTPKYIFYVLMDNGMHFYRLFHTNFPNILDNQYYFTYKLKNNEFERRKPFLNLYYNFAITRHIYNKMVVKYVEKSLAINDPQLYDLIVSYFLTINNTIKNLTWGNEKNLTDETPQFIILTFEGNNEQYWKPQLEQHGIKVINIAELIGIDNLSQPEKGFFMPEKAAHPNGKLWKEVVPKLKELYPDL